MKLHRRHMPVLQPPKARLYILCLFLAAGILAGFLAGRAVASEDLLSLSRYVTGYARLNAEEPRSAGCGRSYGPICAIRPRRFCWAVQPGA